MNQNLLKQLKNKGTNKPRYKDGFIGIVAMLLTVLIIGFFILKTGAFIGKENGQNIIDTSKSAIDQAKAAKNLIEQDNRRAIEQQ
jgi:divalent metal cation (Fe/Co/Zn/Cd) transporter